MIHWSTLIYIIIALLAIALILKDIMNPETGAFNLMGGPSGHSGTPGLITAIVVILFILITGIWGGIFWW